MKALSLLRLLLVLCLGLAAGLGATWISVTRGLGFGAVAAGPWIGFPKSASPGADPYARAALARSGELPLDLAEGLAFTARTDSDGRALDSRCSYVVAGPLPQARFWTLAAPRSDGSFAANALGRLTFTSTEIIRRDGGAWSIVVSADASPGNWLPYRGAGPFQLVLRLYDTPASATAAALRADELPAIRRDSCR